MTDRPPVTLPDASIGPARGINRWTRWRLGAMGLFFAVLGILIAKRAWELQIQDAERLRSLAEDNYLSEIQIPPGRGRILDRHGKELAATAEVESVFGNPRVLAHVPEATRKLARALGLPAPQVERALAPVTREGRPRYFTWLKRRVTPEEAAAVRALALPGVGFRPEPRRFYPLRHLASTVIGHSGADGRGLEGVELAYDEYLRGESATLRGVRDALGRELLVEGLADISGVAGADVTLTLDAYLSHVAREALLRAVTEHNAAAGIAVVVDPRTGELLALVNVPDYNPNQPSSAPEGARNRAITDTFEPGSTIKTFTFAAALDAGKLRPEDTFDCEHGRMKVGKYTIRDTHPLGVVSAAEVYRQSSNICTVKVARRIGKQALHDALVRFGFGRRAGVPLPGERQGILRPTERWGEIGFANVAFGQGITATPLQITMGFAAVAAGGIYRAPRLGVSARYPDGRSEPLEQADPGQRVISERAARTLLEIMAGVPTREGTARLAAVPGYRVAGKTGTAQKVSGGQYDPDRWLASFIGIAPVDDPRLVIGVFVDEPRPIHLGGKVAAPVFREIAEAGLKYLNVPPTEPLDERPGSADPGPVLVTGGAGAWQPDIAEGPGLSTLVVSDDEFFPIDPDAPEPEPVALVTVPDFAGLSLGRALRAASELGLDLDVAGSGVAVAQSVAARREVPVGSRVELTLRPRQP